MSVNCILDELPGILHAQDKAPIVNCLVYQYDQW